MGAEATNRQWRTMSVSTGIAWPGRDRPGGRPARRCVQVGGGEPAFDAPADEILSFFEARNDTLYAAGSFLALIAALALLWFFAGFWAVSAGRRGSAGLALGRRARVRDRWSWSR